MTTTADRVRESLQREKEHNDLIINEFIDTVCEKLKEYKPVVREWTNSTNIEFENLYGFRVLAKGKRRYRGDKEKIRISLEIGYKEATWTSGKLGKDYSNFLSKVKEQLEIISDKIERQNKVSSIATEAMNEVGEDIGKLGLKVIVKGETPMLQYDFNSYIDRDIEGLVKMLRLANKVDGNIKILFDLDKIDEIRKL